MLIIAKFGRDLPMQMRYIREEKALIDSWVPAITGQAGSCAGRGRATIVGQTQQATKVMGECDQRWVTCYKQRVAGAGHAL